jgi:hypothetical protein
VYVLRGGSVSLPLEYVACQPISYIRPGSLSSASCKLSRRERKQSLNLFLAFFKETVASAESEFFLQHNFCFAKNVGLVKILYIEKIWIISAKTKYRCGE